MFTAFTWYIIIGFTFVLLIEVLGAIGKNSDFHRPQFPFDPGGKDGVVIAIMVWPYFVYLSIKYLITGRM